MINHQVKSYIRYWLEAVDHHSLHSPFLFDFYTKVMLVNDDHHQFDQIEEVRQQLLKDDRSISLRGFGAGSKHFSTNTRKINAIAKTSLTPRKFSMLYWAIAHYFSAKTIVELGTSLGTNAAYLAQKNDAVITTFEGESEIANIAKSAFKTLKLTTIELIEGDINTTLPNYLNKIHDVDLAFLDANHQFSATLQYFEGIVKKIHTGSVVILDDIHQSEEMEKAWAKIKSHPLVYCSIDLFRCGIVFFDPSLNKQHVVLQF